MAAVREGGGVYRGGNMAGGLVELGREKGRCADRAVKRPLERCVCWALFEGGGSRRTSRRVTRGHWSGGSTSVKLHAIVRYTVQFSPPDSM